MILESTFHYAAVGMSILLHFYRRTVTELITEKKILEIIKSINKNRDQALSILIHFNVAVTCYQSIPVIEMKYCTCRGEKHI